MRKLRHGEYYDPIAERIYTAPKLDRDSEAHKLMIAAGWTIGEPYFREAMDDLPPTYTMPSLSTPGPLCVNFRCVCGREEIFMRMLGLGEIERSPQFARGVWDACADIERAGAISPEHLRADGFDEKTIERVLFVYGMRDELRKLRRQRKELLCLAAHNLTIEEVERYRA